MADNKKGEHDAHRQRVYNRFLSEGLDGFEEHNAMEFLLFLARARGDTNSLAHTLVNHFGSVANVLDADINDLQSVEGVGQSTAVVLKFIPQMCRYYLDSRVKNLKMMDSVEAVAEFLRPKFFGLTVEKLYMLALDDKRSLIRCICISQGIVNATPVEISKIVAETTKCNASGIIIAHNHIRSTCLPSSADISTTRNVYSAMRMIGAELVDHLIFSDTDYMSFTDTKYMETVKQSLGLR
ncbi:MAG: hypothetical protein EOM30_02120 [Clostridia bacterium]|nr:hypothetical protein [Clostridia bacterium]NLS85848.1 hypothetical protein [Oscillospiraceae bacterium]